MGLFDFLGRHKNKLLLAGGALGSVVVIKKILASYEKDWQESPSRGFVHESTKKQIHFENVINECNHLCQRLSSKLIKRLEAIFNDSDLIEELKCDKIQSKVATWKLLKVRILTKLISEIYCICILVCSMRVQMSIIGGQVFEQSTTNNVKTYTKYVSLLASLYDEKFDYLVQPIEESISKILENYTIDYLVTIQDFKTILDDIKRSLASSNSIKSVFSLRSNSDIQEEELSKLLDETQEIIETEDFKQVLESSIEVGYAILLDSLLGAFIKMESKINGKDHQSGFSNPNAIQVPLVRILSQIRNNHLERSPADQKVLVNHLLCLDVLNCFAANVYEAFCITR